MTSHLIFAVHDYRCFHSNKKRVFIFVSHSFFFFFPIWLQRLAKTFLLQYLKINAWKESRLLNLYLLCCTSMVPNLFGVGTRDWFCGGQFFHGRQGFGGGGMVQAVMRPMGMDGERQMKLCLLAACPLLTSCCAAQFLTGHGQVPVHGPGFGDPCCMWCGRDCSSESISSS